MDKIYRLRISNFLNIESMTLDINGLKGFVGRNAQGKTNILSAVEQLLRGGNDAKYIKDGAEKYEIQLDEIVNEKVINTVKRVQTPTGNTLSGKLDDSTPKQFLEMLLDDVAVNPMKIIDGDPVKYLKSHLTVALQEGDIPEHGMEIVFDKERNVFNECKRHQDYFEKVRVEEYGRLRHAKELCAELQATLPERTSIPVMVKDEIMTELQDVNRKIGEGEAVAGTIKKLTDNKAQRQTNLEKLRNDYADVKAKNNVEMDAYKKEKEKAIADYKHQIELLQQKLTQLETVDYPAGVKNLSTAHEQKLEALKQKAEIEKKEIEAIEAELVVQPTSTDVNDLKIKAVELKNKADEADRWDNIKEQYKKLEKRELEVKQITEEYDRLDCLFKHFAYELPKILITRCELPVEGLEFKDDELYVNGRHIKRLSNAEKMTVAVKLAVALAKKKGHIACCIDGIETLDKENMDLLVQYLKESGLAVLYTRHGKPEYDHEIEIKKGKAIQ